MENKEAFIILYEWMTEIDALKGASLWIYAIIYGFRDHGGFCGSMQYLADRTDVSKRTAYRVVSRLESAGLLRCEEICGQKVWFPAQIHGENVTDSEKKTQDDSEKNTPGCDKKTQESEKISRSCEKNSSNNKEYKRDTKEYTTPYSPPQGSERAAARLTSSQKPSDDTDFMFSDPHKAVNKDKEPQPSDAAAP